MKKKTEMNNCKYAQFAPDMTVGINEPMALPSGEIQNIRRIAMLRPSCRS